MRQKLNVILPPYTYIPLLSAVLFNAVTYFVTRIFTSGMTHHMLGSRFDDMLPFFPFFITFYWLAYIQWGAGFVIIARENKEICYRILSAELIAKIICLFFFIVYPTTLTRPEITGTSVWEQLTALLYRMDPPDNLFPSIHCLESWIVFRGAMECKKIPAWYRPVCLIFSVFVFASTVLLKQHVLVDIAGGILAVEIGLYAARRFKTGRIFSCSEPSFAKISDQ